MGVSSKNDILKYARIPGPMEWGGLIVDKNDTEDAWIKKRVVENVPVVRLAEYMIEVVNTRKLPESAKNNTPQVVMKMDIEGKELEVLPDLLMTGALVSVDRLYMEWHYSHTYFVSKNETKTIKELIGAVCNVAEEKKLLQRCHIQDLDDETYFKFKGELPTCDGR